jgi:tetratricopeptide (TPR) repeat protein
VKAYYNRGILLVAAGDPAAATRDYDAALRLDSAYAAAYHNRANIARKAGSHADAVRDYSAALANMQGEGRKYTLLGRALSLQKLGNVEAARADLQLALSIDPKLHTAREALNELSPGMATDVAAREVDNNNIVTTSLGPTAAATSGEQYISIGSSGGWETVAIRYSTSDLPPQVKYASAAPVELRKQVVMPPVVAVVAATPPKITSTIGRYRVQLASLRSEEIAEDTWSKLQTRADALRALPHNIQQADLGERGIYFRLQVGAFNSAAEAKALCLNLSATNIDCIVVR